MLSRTKEKRRNYELTAILWMFLLDSLDEFSVCVKENVQIAFFAEYTIQWNEKCAMGKPSSRQSPWANYRGIRLLKYVMNNYSSTWHFCYMHLRALNWKCLRSYLKLFASSFSHLFACVDPFITRSLIQVKNVALPFHCDFIENSTKIYSIIWQMLLHGKLLMPHVNSIAYERRVKKFFSF